MKSLIITHKDAWELVRCGFRFEFGKIVDPPPEHRTLLRRLHFLEYWVEDSKRHEGGYYYYKPNFELMKGE